MHDLDQGRQAVGGAGGIGDDLDVLVVVLVVHAHDEHGRLVLGRSGHDHLLRASDEMLGCAFIGQELACGRAVSGSAG